MFWAQLVHLGYNMWGDREQPGRNHPNQQYIVARPWLRCDDHLWRELLERLASAGANMVVIDLGEGVRYRTHPELAVKGSWPERKLRRELDRARGLGLEPIPKLNFSACHDIWLGPYCRMVSTPTYYKVCADLIREVIGLFDKPRFFHLGLDEETASHQKQMAYAVMRQHELWWHDTLYLIDQVERGGSRAWVWADYIWHHHDEFRKQMPRSVLQSNWTDATNFRDTVRYARRHIAAKRLAGFLMTVWKPTLPAERQRHFEAIDQLGEAKTWWDKQR